MSLHCLTCHSVKQIVIVTGVHQSTSLTKTNNGKTFLVPRYSGGNDCSEKIQSTSSNEGQVNEKLGILNSSDVTKTNGKESSNVVTGGKGTKTSAQDERDNVKRT